MPTDRELRDANFSLLGRTRRRPDGRTELLDANGRLRGTYDDRSDETRDPTGRLVGRGDLLTRLLSRA